MAHVPVLLAESLAWLEPREGGIYVDGTFGYGGHTRALAARGARVVAFDLDPGARLPDDLAAQVTLVRRNFAELGAALDELGIERIDGALFDFGVSSMQLDSPERGFSFQSDGELDMRMNPQAGRSAYELLQETPERELADIIFNYGEERAARRIARALVAAREAGRLPSRTLDLARLVSGATHVRGKRERIHPATRTFQALRIAVNDELGSIERGLAAASARLAPHGRIVAISFHSLEDRIVKQTFRADPSLRALTKKPVLPGDEETAANPRSRSAKLRAAEAISLSNEVVP